jgi:4-amino-4-deoxy-L-arabinose transferase-like glycosyltransferase
MKSLRRFWRANTALVLSITAITVVLLGLFFYKLGSLAGGLSANEMYAAKAPLGLHNLLSNPFYLPLKFVRYVIFGLDAGHGQILTRLPNAIFGCLTVVSFGWLIWLWHGRRTAVLTTLMFASAAWVLHVGRLASYDVLYLWGTVTLLLVHVLLYRYTEKRLAWFGSLFIWGLALTVPGMVWFVLADAWLQRQQLTQGWKTFSRWWQRALSIVLPLVWIPLICHAIWQHHGLARTWVGLPAEFSNCYLAVV